MRYEKKMLILSGEGKGVVLIEKSGLGVRFALRTFGLDRAAGRKAGVITSSDVYVRELPDVADPSLVFYLDGAETEPVHFAVFDSELRLYGTNGKRMWEANLMGLLRAHDRAAKPSEPPPARLPPLVQKPRTLPLPDGTGLPQSRDAIYGDEALSASDFYTRHDLTERMRVVDSFLDTPRVLADAPVEYTRLDNPSFAALQRRNEHADASIATAETAETEGTAAEAETNDIAEQVMPQSLETASERMYEAEITAADNDSVGIADFMQSERESADGGAQTVGENMRSQALPPPSQVVQVVQVAQAAETVRTDDAAQDGEKEAACTAPWQYAAKFLCKMSKREAVIEKGRVEPIKQRDKVPPLRETAFFERTRGDVDKLFALAERDGELAALLPEIEWVRVEFDGRTVSVGRSSEFLCYAVAGVYEKVSPLGEEAQWLPRVKSAPTGKGYWLVFQDINTGKILAGCR